MTIRLSFRSLAAALAAFILFALLGCLLDGKQAGRRGSEVENEVYGTLVTRDGSTVAGARVKALPQDTSGNPFLDSVVTDADGRYSFRGLPIGTYTLLGDYESGALVVRIPGVEHADTIGRDSVGVDTLRAPGQLRGRVLLGDRGFGGVLAYLPGTSYLAVSDDSGRFLISGVPQGRYSVKYSVTGYQIDPDTGIFVPSAVTVELPIKRLAADKALPPPAPQGLKAAFDTLRGRASLTWNHVEVADLDGYLVYRDEPGQGVPLLMAGGFTRDTSFIDSTLGDPEAIRSGPIVYRVKARDRGANASLNFSDPAQAPAAPIAMVRTAIAWSGASAGTDTVVQGDTVLAVAEYRNSTRRNRSLTWSVPGQAGPPATRSIDTPAGRDSIAWRATALGEWTVLLVIRDEAGSEWTISRVYHVMRDSLSAIAGPDTTVSLGDSVILGGKAASRFGRLGAYFRWEWDVGGTGRYAPASPGAWGARAPRTAGRHPCILRVTDDFGDTAKDTTWLQVLADPPSVKAAGDTTVSLGDSVSVSATGTDHYGSIVLWEWKTCVDTAFRSGPPRRNLAMPVAATPACRVIARVTDDDGQRAEDTVMVAVVADAPRADAAGDTTVSLGDSVRVSGKGSDGYGRIVKWEWKAGAAEPFREAGPAAWITMPRLADPRIAVVLRVTDDDGQIGLDTLYVKVVADPPKAEAIGSGTVSLNDTLRLEGRGTDGYGRVVVFEWACGTGAPFVKAAAGVYFGTASAAAMAAFPCILRVTDDDGQTGLDTAFFNVVADPPTADLVADLSIGFPGDPLKLTSAGSKDSFGKIVRWDWDVGATGTFKRAGRDTTIALPAALGNLRVVVRVTDDDGQSAQDTVTILVSLSPKVSAGPDTTVRAGGTASLHGKVMAGFGTVSRWEWDIGATGSFQMTTTGDIAFPIPRIAPPLKCVVRAFNTAGAYGSDTLIVTVDGTGTTEWEGFKLPAGLGIRMGTVPVAFKDKLWLFGGATAKDTVLRNDIWSSDDGITWTLRGNAAWKPRYEHKVVEFAGKLWLLGGAESKNVYSPTAEIWSSMDGLAWVKAVVNTPFTARAKHHAFAMDGKLWVGGGVYTDANGKHDKRQTDMWNSPNGLVWTMINMYAAPYGYYQENPKLAVVRAGGLETWDNVYGRWSATDGNTWIMGGVVFEGSVGVVQSLYSNGPDLWYVGANPGTAGLSLWKWWGAGEAILDRGPPIEGIEGPADFVDFRGQPWLFAPTVTDLAGPKMMMYRVKR